MIQEGLRADGLWPRDEESQGVTSPARGKQPEGTARANAESREAGEAVRCHRHTKSRNWGSGGVVVLKNVTKHKAS